MDKTLKEISDEDLMNNAIRFALEKCPTDETGALVDFQKYKKTFYSCTKWLRDNYKPIS